MYNMLLVCEYKVHVTASPLEQSNLNHVSMLSLILFSVRDVLCIAKV